jgi:putative hydrolase
MDLFADLHIHTVASGHAYSTVLEIAQVAVEKGLALIALTDHGPAMPGAPHAYHFGNLSAIPDMICQVRVLKGIEANVIDGLGNLDMDDQRLAKMDIILAGLHTYCAPNGTQAKNTTMLINAIKNPWVDVIVHPGNPEYQIDEQAVVEAATHFGVALEINNSSLTASRAGSKPHCTKIAAWAAQYGCKIMLGSDSHFATAVGNFGAAVQLLNDNGIMPEQVLNTSLDLIFAHLDRRINRLAAVER